MNGNLYIKKNRVDNFYSIKIHSLNTVKICDMSSNEWNVFCSLLLYNVRLNLSRILYMKNITNVKCTFL